MATIRTDQFTALLRTVDPTTLSRDDVLALVSLLQRCVALIQQEDAWERQL